MSEKDNFASGFLIGSIIGGVVGGVVGTLLASKNNISEDENDDSLLKSSNKSSGNYHKSLEDTRLGLEEKINLLNHAIDDVRVTLLKNVNNQEKEKEKVKD